MDDCRAIAVLFDELAVCLGLARRVELARRLAVGAAAPLVRLLAADRAIAFDLLGFQACENAEQEGIVPACALELYGK